MRSHPVLFHGALGLAAALGGAVALWACLGHGSWGWVAWLAAWLAGINLTAFAYYGYDKARARRAARRVPETVLFGLAVAGGSVGAYAGMRLFRHKTVKGSFRLIFWLIVVLQVALIAWIGREVGWHR